MGRDPTKLSAGLPRWTTGEPIARKALSYRLHKRRDDYISMGEVEYSGYNGTLVLGDTGVTIKRGVKGFLLGGGMLRGDKTIPYSSITAVQLKAAGMSAGYIQLSLMGGQEAKAGLLQSTMDENSVHFYRKSNAAFAEAKRVIEERMQSSRGGTVVQAASSSADELAKFAQLRDSGVITEEEFQKKKKDLLGL